jgi:hypothetical protein
MPVHRRAFLTGALALGCGFREKRVPGSIVNRKLKERAHLLNKTRPTHFEAVDIVIVGAGIAGLSAAWRLAKAGFSGSVAILELDDAPGGTSRWGKHASIQYPWGAHYITLPNPDALHMFRILEDQGVLIGWDAAKRPMYDALSLCAEPEERLFVEGSWSEGLWPVVAGKEDIAQRDAFLEEAARWSAWKGKDGKPAFTIPVAGCSEDPEVVALSMQPFADWLKSRGLRGKNFLWWVEYACRDDFGVNLDQVSAWAGLHYFASRRPIAWRDTGTHILTWASGNGRLVEGFLKKIPWTVQAGTGVQAVLPGESVEVWTDTTGFYAKEVILAVPARMVKRWVERPFWPDAAPWRVAQLFLRESGFLGNGLAWDNVLYGSSSLGYLRSGHQEQSRVGGPEVLSWYEPLCEVLPAEGRTQLIEAEEQTELQRPLVDLALAHPELKHVVEEVQLWQWGHGTVIPSVGLHDGRLKSLQAPIGNLHFAHTELSGMSLFEEASWHGIRAAEEVLKNLGWNLESFLR